jgi:hypothetical protein
MIWEELNADFRFTSIPLDAPTMFAGSLYHHRIGRKADATRLLHQGALSISQSPAALWVVMGLATAVLVGGPGTAMDRVEIALGRAVARYGIHLLPPFALQDRGGRGPFDDADAGALILAIEASTPS